MNVVTCHPYNEEAERRLEDKVDSIVRYYIKFSFNTFNSVMSIKGHLKKG